MERIFCGKKVKKILALVVSISMVLIAFLPASSVKALAEPYTHNVAFDAGWHVYDNGAMMGNSGTIPAGAIVGVSNYNLEQGVTLDGIANFSTAGEYAGGRLYTLTSPVNFSINGNVVQFTPGAGAAGGDAEGSRVVAGGDAEGSGVVAGPTDAQIAWAQYHDHAHNSNDTGFTFIVTTPVTEYSDGVEAWGCPECGYIEYRSPISAYDFFNGITTSRFNAAKPGQTITIEAGQWVSFHKSVIDALRKNREITTNIIYKSNGVLSTLTIPRGTDFSNVPEDKYTGIDYLAYCLGIVPVPKFG